MQQIKRFFKAPSTSFFIFGPRGTGKSTWLKQRFPEAYLINLLDHSDYLRHLGDPTLLRKVVEGSLQTQRHFIIDEIQKVPEMLNTIHSLIEDYKDHNLQFIMTGSSARKLRRSGVNLLAGRALLTHFHPFMAAELGELFKIETALEYGLIPLVVGADDPQSTLNAYLGLYLREEVQAESLVRNLGSFSRFLEIMSFSHGSIINLNNIARECQITRKVAENYLSILKDLLIAETLPVFTKRAQRETTAHEKFYYFDVGVYNVARPKGPLDRPEEIYGIALEGLVFQHLRAWRDYSKSRYSIYYWRTKSGSEVDFVVYGNNCFYAIEVKNNKNIYTQDLRHLKTFCADYPEAKPLVLYRGKDRLMIDKITCWPIHDFLLNLLPDKFPLSAVH